MNILCPECNQPMRKFKAFEEIRFVCHANYYIFSITAPIRITSIDVKVPQAKPYDDCDLNFYGGANLLNFKGLLINKFPRSLKPQALYQFHAKILKLANFQ